MASVDDGRLVLGYWAIRGLAEPIRLLLKYTGKEYSDQLYHQGGPPDYSRADWYDVKHKLGLDFPNLPYLIDGDLRITQSMAILKYLAKKTQLSGDSARQRARVDMIAFELADARCRFTGICYSPRFNELLPPFLDTVPETLQGFDSFLGDNTFICGDISYADFLLYEMLQQYSSLASLAPFPRLVAYSSRFEALPALAPYFKDDQRRPLPFNNRVAKFGGDI